MVDTMPNLQYQQLNPLTPMAYLSPDLAFQTTISAYMFVACCGVGGTFVSIQFPKLTVDAVDYDLGPSGYLEK